MIKLLRRATKEYAPPFSNPKGCVVNAKSLRQATSEHSPSPLTPSIISPRVQDQGNGGDPGLSQEGSGGRSEDKNGADAVRRMLQLLGPQGEASGASEGSEAGKAGQATSVEDFPALLGESYLREATHSTATRMRSRLFQV